MNSDSSTMNHEEGESQPHAPDKHGFRGDLRHFTSGILMGAADVVPGVSGGTVALVLGVYSRLVNAITRANQTFVGHLVRREMRAAAHQIDFRFVAALGAGIAIGILSLASLMHFLLENFENRTNAVFCGLILASTLIVGRRINDWSRPTLVAFVAGTTAAAILVGVPVFQSPPAARWYVFVCGTVGICAMILPGISGAFILLILGKYKYITGLLKAMLHREATMSDMLTVFVFCLGCLTGLLAFSRFLKWLLIRHHDLTLAVLSGFMLGSLRKLWPFHWPLTDGRETVLVGTLFVLATGLVLLLDLASRLRRANATDGR